MHEYKGWPVCVAMCSLNENNQLDGNGGKKLTIEMQYLQILGSLETLFTHGAFVFALHFMIEAFMSSQSPGRGRDKATGLATIL